MEGPTDPMTFFGMVGAGVTMFISGEIQRQLAAAAHVASNPPGVQIVKGAEADRIARLAKKAGQA